MKKDEAHKEQMQIPTLKPNHFLQWKTQTGPFYAEKMKSEIRDGQRQNMNQKFDKPHGKHK